MESLVGLQAQEPVDPYVGLWARIDGFDPASLSELIEARAALRLGLMRTTLHLVSRADALGLAPVMGAVHRRTFRTTPFAQQLEGVEPAEVIAAAQALLETAPMTPSDLGRALAARWPDRDPSALAYLARYHLALVQVPPRGLWGRTGRATNTTLDAWTGAEPEAYPLDEIVLRYLRAFGPASSADVRTWSWLTGLRPVIDGLRSRLRTYRDERGRELFDVEDGVIVDADRPAPVRFLPQYDNAFLSHDDRSRINGAIAWGTHFGWKGVLLVDGFIEGAWRVRREAGVARMTIELARTLTPTETTEVEDEADALSAFLDRDLVRERVIVPAGGSAAG